MFAQLCHIHQYWLLTTFTSPPPPPGGHPQKEMCARLCHIRQERVLTTFTYNPPRWASTKGNVCPPLSHPSGEGTHHIYIHIPPGGHPQKEMRAHLCFQIV
jgi:hypothetical protein